MCASFFFFAGTARALTQMYRRRIASLLGFGGDAVTILQAWELAGNVSSGVGGECWRWTATSLTADAGDHSRAVGFPKSGVPRTREAADRLSAAGKSEAQAGVALFGKGAKRGSRHTQTRGEREVGESFATHASRNRNTITQGCSL